MDIIVDTCSITEEIKVEGAHGIVVEADEVLGKIDSIKTMMVWLYQEGYPGAMA